MVDVCVLGPSKSFLQEAFVRDLDRVRIKFGDDVVFYFSIRVQHAATSDDVEDTSRWWTRPQERIVRLGSIASKAEFSGAKSAIRLRAHGVQSLQLLPEHRPLGSVSRMRLAVYLASLQVRRIEHGGS